MNNNPYTMNDALLINKQTKKMKIIQQLLYKQIKMKQ